MSGTVIDPGAESPEFCLDCAEKHIGQASINVDEALDRLRNFTSASSEKEVDNLVEFVLRHVNKAQSELSEVEEHTKHATDADIRQKKELDAIANEARIIRDKLRNFNKSFPQEPKLELILDAQKKTGKLNTRILFTKKRYGCGECQANKEELEAIRDKLLKNRTGLELDGQEPVNKPADLKTPPGPGVAGEPQSGPASMEPGPVISTPARSKPVENTLFELFTLPLRTLSNFLPVKKEE